MDLKIEGFSATDGSPRGVSFAFSMSEALLQFLKPNFGKKSFMDDLPVEGDGSGELRCISLHTGLETEHTLVGVEGMLLLFTSSDKSSEILDGISRERF